MNQMKRFSTVLLWVLVLLSLGLNVLLLSELNRIRLAAIDGLGQAETTLVDLSDEVISYEFEVDRTIPVMAEVPFQRTFQVPIKTSVPIDQVFNVPIETPLGVIDLDVPLKTEFPVDVVIPITIDETIGIETEVPLILTVPIALNIAETPLGGFLLQAQETLAGFRADLARPFGAGRPG
jgi:hypothetical protein